MAKKAKKFGRPTKYKPEYCEQLLEFFDIPFFKTVKVQKMSASGAVETLDVSVPNDFPMLEDFCWKINICPETISNWCKQYPDFFKAVKRAKGIQKRFLVKHGLTGAYNAKICTLMAVNVTDLVDKSEVKSETTVKAYGLGFDLSEKPKEVE